MIKTILGKTGWEVAAIGQGLWNIGNQWGIMDDHEAEKIILAGYERGINLYDVAESYGIPNGLSEIRLGKTLKKMKRDKVHIVSKIGHWGGRTGQKVPKTTPDMIRLCGHAILGRLSTEYLDVVLCHEGNLMEPDIYIEGFEKLKQEGFIREYGISTNELSILKIFNEKSKGKCAVVEVDYSLLNKDPENGFINYCVDNNIGILVRGGLHRGLLSGKYNKETVFSDKVRENWNEGGKDRETYLSKLEDVQRIKNLKQWNEDLATIAIRYAISNKANPVIIPGTTKVEQVIKNVKAGQKVLSREEYELLKNV